MSVTAVDQQHSHVDQHENAHGPEISFAQQLKNNRLGLWMFCFSELFLFGALLAARFTLWGNTRPDLSQVVGLITTSILLISSFYVNRGESAIEHGDRKTFLSSYLVAAFLGSLFFIGVVVFEWNVFGLEYSIGSVELFGHLRPTDGVYASVFFAMTGMHTIHVVTGIIFLLIVWRNGRNGHFSSEKHWGVEASAIYWHYVDVIWIFFYPALYLIGSVAG